MGPLRRCQCHQGGCCWYQQGTNATQFEPQFKQILVNRVNVQKSSLKYDQIQMGRGGNAWLARNHVGVVALLLTRWCRWCASGWHRGRCILDHSSDAASAVIVCRESQMWSKTMPVWEHDTSTPYKPLLGIRHLVMLASGCGFQCYYSY